jgi:hypothetical protein
MPRLAIAFAVAVHLLGTDAAAADFQGATGSLVGLQINGDSSDQNPTHEGLLWVETDGALVQYVWKGAVCSTLGIEGAEIEILQSGLDNPRILIQPFYKAGSNQARCLVAYRLIHRSWEGLF